MDTYRVVRGYYDGYYNHLARGQVYKRVIARGLSLDEAQAHCRNPETHSRTARGAKAHRRTRRHGPWFDGYERE
jgi:hypothetical protein